MTSAVSVSQVSQIFGAPANTPGIQVTEQVSLANAPSTTPWTTAFEGVLKRGPQGVWIPLDSVQSYQSIYGNPSDSTWSLYADSSFFTADALYNYYLNNGGVGRTWVMRIEGKGDGVAASVTLNSLDGDNPATVFTAANAGGWGGKNISLPTSAIPLDVSNVTASTVSFYIPDVKTNQLVGGSLSFASDIPGTQTPSTVYTILANTATDAVSGQVVITVGPQYNLLSDHVVGPKGVPIDPIGPLPSTSPIAQFRYDRIVVAPSVYVTKGSSTLDLQGIFPLSVGATLRIDGAGYGGNQYVGTITGVAPSGTTTVVSVAPNIGTSVGLKPVNKVAIGASATTVDTYASFPSGINYGVDRLLIPGGGVGGTSNFEAAIIASTGTMVTLDAAVPNTSLGLVPLTSVNGVYGTNLFTPTTGTLPLVPVGTHITVTGAGTAGADYVGVVTASTHQGIEVLPAIETAVTAAAGLVSGTAKAFVVSPVPAAIDNYTAYLAGSIAGNSFLGLATDITTGAIKNVLDPKQPGSLKNIVAVSHQSVPVPIALTNLDTGSSTSGSTLLTATALHTFPIFPLGSLVTGTGVAANTTVVASSLTNLTISTPLTGAATAISITVPDFFVIENSATEDLRFSGNIASGTQLFYPSPIYGQIEVVTPATDGLYVKIEPGSKYPLTHFGITVFFGNSKVLNFPDASLDPADKFFLDTVVAQSPKNSAYSTASESYHTWAVSDSSVSHSNVYDTAKGSDARPFAGGEILAVYGSTLYLDSPGIDYSLIGKYKDDLLYPDVYGSFRTYFIATGGTSPFNLEGVFVPGLTSGAFSVNGQLTGGSFIGAVVGDFVSFTDNAGLLYTARLATINNNLGGGDDQAVFDTINSISPEGIVTAITPNAAFVALFATTGIALRVLGSISVSSGINLLSYTSIGKVAIAAYRVPLAGGYDGDLSALNSYDYTRYLNTINDTLYSSVYGLQQGLIRIAIPGVNDIATQQAGVAYAHDRAYEFRCEFPPEIGNAASAELYVKNVLGANDFQSIAYPSYVYVSNPLGAGQRYIPATGSIMGVETRLISAGGDYHINAAGASAILQGSVKFPVSISLQDQAILNPAGIQMLTVVNGNPVVWGSRIPAQNAVYTFLSYRRQLSDIGHVLQEYIPAINLLFTPNTPDLQVQLQLLINSYLAGKYAGGSFFQFLGPSVAYSVKVVSLGGLGGGAISTGTLQAIQNIINGEQVVYVSFIPAPPLERVDFVVGLDGALAIIANQG